MIKFIEAFRTKFGHILKLLPKKSYVTECYITIVTFCYNIVNSFLKGENAMNGMIGLKSARKSRGLSQLKVAMDLNISREALSYYENGKRSPDLDMLRKLSEYFSLSIDFLINGKEFGQ